MAAANQTIEVYVKNMTGDLFSIEIEPSRKIGFLKYVINDIKPFCDVNQMKLVKMEQDGFTELENKRTLVSYGINDNMSADFEHPLELVCVGKKPDSHMKSREDIENSTIMSQAQKEFGQWKKLEEFKKSKEDEFQRTHQEFVEQNPERAAAAARSVAEFEKRMNAGAAPLEQVSQVIPPHTSTYNAFMLNYQNGSPEWKWCESKVIGQVQSPGQLAADISRTPDYFKTRGLISPASYYIIFSTEHRNFALLINDTDYGGRAHNSQIFDNDRKQWISSRFYALPLAQVSQVVPPRTSTYEASLLDEIITGSTERNWCESKSIGKVTSARQLATQISETPDYYKNFGFTQPPPYYIVYSDSQQKFVALYNMTDYGGYANNSRTLLSDLATWKASHSSSGKKWRRSCRKCGRSNRRSRRH